MSAPPPALVTVDHSPTERVGPALHHPSPPVRSFSTMSTATPELASERTRSPRRIRGTGFVWLLVLPGLAMLVAVVLYPLLRSIAMAFFDESLLYPGREFVGLENFTAVLSEDFPQLLWQTLIFTVGATVLPLLIGLALALALDTGIRGRG